MKIVSFGSLNMDLVYIVDDFVKCGQTISSLKMGKYPGGKGLNQSIAAKRAGAEVLFAGSAGSDGKFLLDYLESNLIDSEYIKRSSEPSGHAIIQVNKKGENCIIVHPGANYDFDEKYIDVIFTYIEQTDIILLQNEINMNKYIISEAKKRNLKVVFNPSPFTDEIFEYGPENVSCFILNEDEGRAFTGKTKCLDILDKMSEVFPKAEIVLTLGENGAVAKKDSKVYRTGIFETSVEDTTGAGDTFTGYYLAAKISGANISGCLRLASAASALCVSKKGAAISIPLLAEVEDFMRRYNKEL